MTFTLYDPATHSLTQLVNAVLGSSSGIAVVPGSITLKYGTELDADSPGSTTSLSFYDGSVTALGIGAGLLLTSGDGSPPESNTSGGYSVALDPSQTDASLTQAVQTAFTFAGEVQDATVLEFQFTVSDPSLIGVRFDLVFGSDEYPEYVDSSYVDIAGVFVNGVNYALFNGLSNQPLSVIGPNLEMGGFENNGDGALPIEYDGILRLVSVVAPVQQGVNTLKIGVADTGDQILDSGLFVANVRAVSYSGGGLLTVSSGSDGADVLTGFAFNELFDAGSGNDTITGNGGDDLILGGAGIDTALFSGNHAANTITKTASGYTVSGPEGNDTLSNIERLKFSDQSLAIDMTVGEAGGKTALLLGACLGANGLSNQATVGAILGYFDGGYTLTDAATALVDAGIVAQLAGGADNKHFVDWMALNLVDALPDASTEAVLIDFITSGQFTQATFLATLAAHQINQDHIGLTGLQDNGMEYV